jgi:hypothetical protein
MTEQVQILNEEGVEIMYDRISLPQEEIIANLLQSYHAALGHALYYA